MNNQQNFKGKGIAIAADDPTKEKRRHRRTKPPKGLKVAWHSSVGMFVSNVSDLGLGGTFIVTPEPPPVGASLRLLFDAPGKQLEACAIVRRSLSGQGMGVEFEKMESEDWVRLQELLKDSAVSACRIRSADRRGQLRYNFPASIEIREAESGDLIEARLDDLGRGGCKVKSAHLHPVGTKLRVVLTKETETFEAEARVASAVPDQGMGLTFTIIEPAQLQTLESWLETAQGSAWLAANRRMAQRLSLAIPVQVEGTDSHGACFAEDAKTLLISSRGALISLRTALNKGQRVVVSNSITKARMECTVVYISKPQDDRFEVGAAFDLPTKAFWGVEFPPSNWSYDHPDAKTVKRGVKGGVKLDPMAVCP